MAAVVNRCAAASPDRTFTADAWSRCHRPHSLQQSLPFGQRPWRSASHPL